MPQFTLKINGRAREIDAEADDSLLSVLRYDLGLTGSKYGCGEGQCGACTVHLNGQATRSCVTRVGAVEDASITTIEGLSTGDLLHPVQLAFLEEEAFQCGYCTSGMVMSAVALLRAHPHPTDEEIVTFMSGNICRCGTYARVVRAVKLAASRVKTSPSARRQP